MHHSHRCQGQGQGIHNSSQTNLCSIAAGNGVHVAQLIAFGVADGNTIPKLAQIHKRSVPAGAQLTRLQRWRKAAESRGQRNAALVA